MPVVKGIKKGKNIELLEDVNLPDGQEILIDIQVVDDFWSRLVQFREQMVLEGIDFDEEDPFVDVRDKSTGRDVNL
ncbi:MAG: hypothetical protein AB4426_22540 [Xenococcaceae cyanobacterium]